MYSRVARLSYLSAAWSNKAAGVGPANKTGSNAIQSSTIKRHMVDNLRSDFGVALEIFLTDQSLRSQPCWCNL